MKTLLLLRHAKALRQPVDDDLERALAPEGIEACARMGRFLKAAGIVPTTLLTSPARRARETLAEVAAAADWHQPHEVRPFHEVKPAGVIAELRLVPDSSDLTIAVGHEPTWSMTVGKLIGGGEVHLPTCGVACIGFDLESWSDLTRGRGRLRWLVPPELLGQPPLIARPGDTRARRK